MDERIQFRRQNDRENEKRLDGIDRAVVELTGTLNARFAALEGTIEARLVSIDGKIELLSEKMTHARTDTTHALGGFKDALTVLNVTVDSNRTHVVSVEGRVGELEKVWREEVGVRRGISAFGRVLWAMFGSIIVATVAGVVYLVFGRHGG